MKQFVVNGAHANQGAELDLLLKYGIRELCRRDALVQMHHHIADRLRESCFATYYGKHRASRWISDAKQTLRILIRET